MKTHLKFLWLFMQHLFDFCSVVLVGLIVMGLVYGLGVWVIHHWPGLIVFCVVAAFVLAVARGVVIVWEELT